MIEEPELWKVIPSFDLYEASNLGDIRRIRHPSNGRYGVVLSQNHLGGGGYLGVILSMGNIKTVRGVNRLVCEAFHGPPPTFYHQAAHGDGNKYNNRENNLRWATPKENAADKKNHGTDQSGSTNYNAKLTELDVANARRLYNEDKLTIKELARLFSVSTVTIQFAIEGKTWKHVEEYPPVDLVWRGRTRPEKCIRGHLFSDNNVFTYKNGTRACIICRRMHSKNDNEMKKKLRAMKRTCTPIEATTDR